MLLLLKKFNYFLLSEHTTLVKTLFRKYIAQIPLLDYYPPMYIFVYNFSFEPLYILEHHIMLSPLLSSI